MPGRPARERREARRETERRASLTPPSPIDICRCQPGPILVATFRPPHPGADAELAKIERVHWAARDRCPMPAEHLTPHQWLRTEPT
jgi:hypothetical protein